MPRDPTRAEVLQDALLDSMRRNRDPIKAANERTAPIMPHTDVQQALQERELQLLQEKFEALAQKVEALASDRDKALRWGILALGTAVVGMGTWIFNLIAAKVH